MLHIVVIVVQSPSRVWIFATPWSAEHQAALSLPSPELLKIMSTASLMPSSHLILCHPPLLLPSIFPGIKDFPKESSVCIRWAKYWSFSCSISPSNEYSGLISLKIDWFDLLAVQGTFKSLLQHHSSKASILWRSAFLMVQLYGTYFYMWRTEQLSISETDNRVDTFHNQIKKKGGVVIIY